MRSGRSLLPFLTATVLAAAPVPGAAPAAAQAPALWGWHSMQPMDLTRRSCFERGQRALRAAGFERILTHEDYNTSAIGRFLHAAISCVAVGNRSIVDIAVAGAAGHRDEALQMRDRLRDYMLGRLDVGGEAAATYTAYNGVRIGARHRLDGGLIEDLSLPECRSRCNGREDCRSFYWQNAEACHLFDITHDQAVAIEEAGGSRFTLSSGYHGTLYSKTRGGGAPPGDNDGAADPGARTDPTGPPAVSGGPATYTAYEGVRIGAKRRLDGGHIRGLSLPECRRQCDGREDCLSFYWQNGTACQLYDITHDQAVAIEEAGGSRYTLSSGYHGTLYSKTRGGGAPPPGDRGDAVADGGNEVDAREGRRAEDPGAGADPTGPPAVSLGPPRLPPAPLPLPPALPEGGAVPSGVVEGFRDAGAAPTPVLALHQGPPFGGVTTPPGTGAPAAWDLEPAGRRDPNGGAWPAIEVVNARLTPPRDPDGCGRSTPVVEVEVRGEQVYDGRNYHVDVLVSGYLNVDQVEAQVRSAYLFERLWPRGSNQLVTSRGTWQGRMPRVLPARVRAELWANIEGRWTLVDSEETLIESDFPDLSLHPAGGLWGSETEGSLRLVKALLMGGPPPRPPGKDGVRLSMILPYAPESDGHSGLYSWSMAWNLDDGKREIEKVYDPPIHPRDADWSHFMVSLTPECGADSDWRTNRYFPGQPNKGISTAVPVRWHTTPGLPVGFPDGSQAAGPTAPASAAAGRP